MISFDDDGDKPVVTPAALEVYFERFRQLVADHPEVWFLCVKAEDRARAELFPRLRREGRQPANASWDAAVFLSAAESDKYWDREVRRPALRFLAKGGGKDQSFMPLSERIEAPHRAAIEGESSTSANAGGITAAASRRARRKQAVAKSAPVQRKARSQRTLPLHTGWQEHLLCLSWPWLPGTMQARSCPRLSSVSR
eukprot:6464456-Amphidinium_carterae.2